MSREPDTRDGRRAPEAPEASAPEEASPPEKAHPAPGAKPAKGAAPPGAAKAPGSPPVELAKGAAWLVGVAAVGQVIATLFQSSPLGTVVLSAAFADLALGRAGVRWDPAAGENTVSDPRAMARRIAAGAGGALAVTGVVVALGLVLGWAKVAVGGSVTSLVLGLVRAVAIAVRDGLLYAGLPLYFVGRAKGIPLVSGVVFGALAAGAGLVLQPEATPAGVALAVAVGAAAAAFWLHDGSGWAAAGVHGGFVLVASVLLRGGLFDVDWTSGRLVHGVRAGGAPAWLCAAGFVGLAAALLVRARRRAASGGASGAAG